MLIWTSESIKDGYTDTFQASSQPFFIVLRGDFAPKVGMFGAGIAQVQYQATNGEWIDDPDNVYRRPQLAMFRLPPGGKGRVSVRGCGGIVIEMHDSDPMPIQEATDESS